MFPFSHICYAAIIMLFRVSRREREVLHRHAGGCCFVQLFKWYVVVVVWSRNAEVSLPHCRGALHGNAAGHKASPKCPWREARKCMAGRTSKQAQMFREWEVLQCPE